MKDIYTLSDQIKAHLIVHKLEQEGIKAWINGEYLSSTTGGMVPCYMIRISVIDEDAERARNIILKTEEEHDATEGISDTEPGKRLLGVTASIVALLTGAYLPVTARPRARLLIKILLLIVMGVVIVTLVGLHLGG